MVVSAESGSFDGATSFGMAVVNSACLLDVMSEKLDDGRYDVSLIRLVQVISTLRSCCDRRGGEGAKEYSD